MITQLNSSKISIACFQRIRMFSIQKSHQSQYIYIMSMLEENHHNLQNLIAVVMETIKAPSKEKQDKLMEYAWQDYLSIIKDVTLPDEVRMACCTVVKTLIYKKKFIKNPLEVFQAFFNYYISIEDSSNPKLPSKIQKVSEIVLEVISSVYLTEKSKNDILMDLCEQLSKNPQNSIKLLKIIQIQIQSMEAESINNEVYVGELILFLQHLLASNLSDADKVAITNQLIKLFELMIELVNDNSEQQNIVHEYIRKSDLIKDILQEIICGSNGSTQIISGEKNADELKLSALNLYSSTWIYNPNEKMFKMCLSSLITRPDDLQDEQAEIMEKVVVFIQRSVAQKQYYHLLHSNTQVILCSLLGMLTPRQSYLNLLETQPQYFVEIGEDFCIQQHLELLMTRVGSLISNLCLYIDGYVSFLCSTCIMMIKKFDKSADLIPNSSQYFQSIHKFWPAPIEQQLATSLLILSMLSDQFEKRSDLNEPLQRTLFNISPLLAIGSCELPPYIICRFMMLYSFHGYPSCLDIFLPYKQVKAVFDFQLQSCYRILHRYFYRRNEKMRIYIDSIGPFIIISNQLTPLLEQHIMDSKNPIAPSMQFNIVENLVNWFQEGYEKNNIIVCNKTANLLTVTIQRLTIDYYIPMESTLFGYLHPLYKSINSLEGSNVEQFIIDIAAAHIKRFPNISENEERMLMFFNMGKLVVERNNYVLNNCLDLFIELSYSLSYQLTYQLIEMAQQYILRQQFSQDKWEYYYLLQICALRVGQLRGAMPAIRVYEIMGDLINMSKILQTKSMMFIYSTFMANPKQQYLRNALKDKPIPTQVAVYENKAFCIYIITLASNLIDNPQYTFYLLKNILTIMKREETIAKELKQFEQQIYNLEHDNSEVVINAFTKTRTLPHPLCRHGVDVFHEFRKMWNEFPIAYRQDLMGRFSAQEKEQIQDVYCHTVINDKSRRIFKVKKNMENSPKENISDKINNSEGSGSGSMEE